MWKGCYRCENKELFNICLNDIHNSILKQVQDISKQKFFWKTALENYFRKITFI